MPINRAPTAPSLFSGPEALVSSAAVISPVSGSMTMWAFGIRGGRPVDFDSEAYKGRSVVEQSFNIFKQWRSIATRYDKLAITYRSGVALYSVLIWLRQ
jgi:transposase